VKLLRAEILQAQKARSDLLKWKIALVGVIGAAGLGLAGSHIAGHPALVLCAIPPVCAYVDLLCRHLSLRMLVIGAFFRTEPDTGDAGVIPRYEKFAAENRRAFGLEDWALMWSTVAVSVAVAAYGVGVGLSHKHHNIRLMIVYLLAGLAGGALTVWAGWRYDKLSEPLESTPSGLEHELQDRGDADDDDQRA
jgi:hypothetical protein